jgi:EAL domain-containing protein (putative c-di-GMP-specific phosphodiesterase class I)/FixJ family two-component response regulator
MHDLSGQVALVVEDSRVQREHLTSLVRAAGFGVVLEACDGNDALRVIERHGSLPLHLVLTDLDMPGMNGIELIRHLVRGKLTENLIVTSACDPRLLEIVESMGSEDAGMCLLGTVLKPMRQLDLTLMLERVGRVARAAVATASASTGASLSLEDIEQGIARGQFVAFVQPKLALDTGLIKGVEALARWQHPELGLIAPNQFIPRLEGSTLMEPFTLAIVAQVLPMLRDWRALGLSSLTASINLSAENLSDHDFIDLLAERAAAARVPPSALVWEVTETMVMSNLSMSLSNLARLSLKGFGLAMDDYGIGYSSVQQLSRCPFTELKIDRAFVHEAAQRPNRRVILESSIEMGRRLGVCTVAEGVETIGDWHLLRELRCDVAQGYLVARPMPGALLVDWIKSNRGRLRELVTA